MINNIAYDTYRYAGYGTGPVGLNKLSFFIFNFSFGMRYITPSVNIYIVHQVLDVDLKTKKSLCFQQERYILLRGLRKTAQE